MNSPLTTTAIIALVLTGLAAEANLLRMFLRDWRDARRQHRRNHAMPKQLSTQLDVSGARRPPHHLTRMAAAGVGSAAVALAPIAARAQSSSSDPPALNTDVSFTPQTQPPELTIAADRPGFSDTTSIAPVGHLQLETGYTFTFRNRDDVETQRHNAPEILARVGLVDDRFELRFLTSGYTWSRSNSGSGYESVEGFSDIALGFKLKLTDQDGALPRLALGFATTLGAGSRDISNREVEPTAKLIWSYDLQKALGDSWKGFSVGGNLILSYPSTDGDHFLQGAASISGSYAFTDTLSGFVEYFVVGPNSKGADAAHSIDFGAAYLLTPRIQLDARLGFGLNQEADNLFAGAGISFLF